MAQPSTNIDLVGNVPVSDGIKDGTTTVTPLFAKIDASASADLIALVTGKKIRVLAGFLTVAADTTVKFQTGGTTDLTGAMTVKAGGGFVLPFNQAGYFETASGAKLNLVLGTSTQTSGGLTYITV